ncbi:MAG: DUF4258 domain-containing protein [Ilyomonas sp.]
MKRYLPLIVLVILAIITVVVKHNNKQENDTSVTQTSRYKTDNSRRNQQSRGLNRNPSHISYSKHARCRMGCRHIDESEVKQILREGKINYSKSELKADECHKRYAVEGITHDDQKVRIIFAPCWDEVTVVTVIDLEKEWPCDCK